MGISPGTERSIMKIAERLPSLEVCMRDLNEGLDAFTAVLDKQAVKLDGPRCEDMPLRVALTDEEWVEVANAIQLKAERLRKDELPGDDMTQEQLNEWAETLESAYKKITKVLDINGIPY